jgi:hypothetical protein
VLGYQVRRFRWVKEAEDCGVLEELERSG